MSIELDPSHSEERRLPFMGDRRRNGAASYFGSDRRISGSIDRRTSNQTGNNNPIPGQLTIEQVNDLEPFINVEEIPNTRPVNIVEKKVTKGLFPSRKQPEAEDIFERHPGAKYYIGVLAVNDQVLAPGLLAAYYRMRAATYIDEMGFLPPEARNADGGEGDKHDNRSVHMAAIEKGPNGPEVIGTTRLIVKQNKRQNLPVEAMFPEVGDSGIPVGSYEVSRYSARHPNKTVQRMVALGLMRAIVGYTVKNSYGPAFAVVEKPLALMFERIRLPYEKIGDSKMVEEYRTENFPIKIDPRAVISSIRPENHVNSSRMMQAFFARTMQNMGLGYYDETMIREA